jgi:hypothetical protein
MHKHAGFCKDAGSESADVPAILAVCTEFKLELVTLIWQCEETPLTHNYLKKANPASRNIKVWVA